MSYVPTYSEVEKEIVSVTLNLSHCVTQKEFKSLTKVDTSDFALKTNVAQIKKKIDNIDIDKINGIDALQGKIMLKTVICILVKNINMSKQTILISFCHGDHQEYLMKNLNH